MFLLFITHSINRINFSFISQRLDDEVMNIAEKEFLSVLSAFFNGSADIFIPEENFYEVILLAKKHNVLPMVCEVLSKNNGKEKRFQSEKATALMLFSSQCVRTERFLFLYRLLLKAGITPLCVKGITLRSLYKNGSIRPSTDEDLLVKKEDMPLFEKLMEENGFELKSEGKNEKTYIERETSLIIEAHTSLFCEREMLGKTLDELFSNPFDFSKTVMIENTPILTLDAQKGLLYLVCHAFKHFIRCGVGIRQVCDIAVYMRSHKAELDIPLLESELSKLNADVFFKALVNIAVKHLGFEDIAFPSLDKELDEQPLLEDILRGGIYGKGESARVHAAPLTLSAAEGKGKTASVFSAVFPSFKKLSLEYPSLKKFFFLYPFFLIWRIAKYLFCVAVKKEEHSTPKESLKKGEERKELLKKYKII